jgi:hypothetical protein
MPDDERPLDSTDTIQILTKIKDWIDGLGILTSNLNLEYIEGYKGFGFVMKSDGGSITEEDILGNFSAEIPFIVYSTGQAIKDATNLVFKPLNDLGAYFRKNKTLGLDIGARRTPVDIKMIRAPTDPFGQDEEGKITFIAQFLFQYDENKE